MTSMNSTPTNRQWWSLLSNPGTSPGWDGTDGNSIPHNPEWISGWENVTVLGVPYPHNKNTPRARLCASILLPTFPWCVLAYPGLWGKILEVPSWQPFCRDIMDHIHTLEVVISRLSGSWCSFRGRPISCAEGIARMDSVDARRRRGPGYITPNACRECRKKRAKVLSTNFVVNVLIVT